MKACVHRDITTMYVCAMQADGSRELEYRAGEEEPQAPHAELKQAQQGKQPELKPGEGGRDESAAEAEESAGDGHVNEAEQEQFEDRTFAAPQVRSGLLPECISCALRNPIGTRMMPHCMPRRACG